MSAEPTREQLAAVLRHPNTYGPPPDRYSGGFRLRHPSTNQIEGSVSVESCHGDIDVTVSADSGRACSTVVAGLSIEEALELSLALEKAAEAAKNYERER